MAAARSTDPEPELYVGNSLQILAPFILYPVECLAAAHRRQNTATRRQEEQPDQAERSLDGGRQALPEKKKNIVETDSLNY